MRKFSLDYNARQIVNAAVRIDARAEKKSDFAKRAAEAITKAKEDMDIGEVAPEIRKAIIDKIYQSIAHNQPWEYLGETYCYRGQFYQYRKQFCYLVAANMGLTNRKRRQPGGG